jgi:serine/threonine protein kinase
MVTSFGAPIALAPGRRLGPYEILAALDAGGQGEVYRAADKRLGRNVAIKVLPEDFSSNPDLKARLDREARAISALNHPHICHLYDVGSQDGTDYLVMELLEGETLELRLRRGALPLPEILSIGTDVAGALEVVHRAGIVHRDLKPANVMLVGRSGTSDPVAKLVDFGLAKRAAPVAKVAAVSGLATEAASDLTAQGTILGTLQYMAPEQLEGKEADARSDIWAFGAVLYEMLTGRRAFEGKSYVSLIAAILEHEPAPITAVQPLTPPALDRIVRTCLAKDPDKRWQSIADVRHELTWAAQRAPESAEAGVTSSRARSRRERFAWTVAAVSLAAAVTVGTLWMTGSRQTAPATMRLSLDVPEAALHAFAALSPDGRQLAFLGPLSVGGRPQSVIWIRALDGVEDRPLAETIGASFPFWSADSRSLGFFSDQKLKRIDLATGLVEKICDVQQAARGGTWSQGGTIVFAGRASPLFRVDARPGSTPTQLTRLQPHELGHRLPAFLEDGRHIVFMVLKEHDQNNTLSVTSLDSDARTDLVTAPGLATQTQSAGGYLLFVRDGSVFAQRLDRTLTRLEGDALLLARSVAVDDYSWQAFAAAPRGVLVFRAEPDPIPQQLTWYARDGTRGGTVWEPSSLGPIAGSSWAEVGAVPFALSPDDTQVAVWRDEPSGSRALWIVNVARNTARLLSKDAGQEVNKVIWSPDGTRVVFGRLRRWGAEDLYARRADGTGDDEPLTNADALTVAAGWLPGDRLLYAVLDESSSNTYNLWTLSPPPDRRAAPFLSLRINGASANRLAVSPNGQLLAYVSNESGNAQIHVKSFTGIAGAQVTRDGGANPAWNGDGTELFYTSGRKLLVVRVRLGATVEVGPPTVLFDLPVDGALFQPTHDGRRFLIDVPQTPVNPPGPASYTVLVNWQGLLDKR